MAAGVSPMVNAFHPPMIICPNPSFTQFGQGVQASTQPVSLASNETGQNMDHSYTATPLTENPVGNTYDRSVLDLTNTQNTAENTDHMRVDSPVRNRADSENTVPKRVESPVRSRSQSSKGKSREKRSESVHPYHRNSRSRTRNETESRPEIQGLPGSINRHDEEHTTQS